MQIRSLAAAMAVAAVAATSVIAQDATVSGSGSAQVTRDVESVRSLAEAAAKRDLVRSLSRQILGAERARGLTDEVVDSLATQIRSEMITGRSSERIGQTYRITLTAQIDRRWFQGQLSDFGVRSSLDFAGGDEQLIAVMIDEAIGVAPDHSQPAEIVTEYDRDRGASYSDQSTLAYSDRARSADSSAAAASSSSNGSFAVGYSDGYGSAAARGNARSSDAYAARRDSASSRNTSLIDRTDVEASEHDVQRFRQRITYQSAATSQTGQAAMTALKDGLRDYDISTSDAAVLMAGFAPGPMPSFEDLSSGQRLDEFFSYARGRSTPFVLSGLLEINHGGRHAATGEATCTGEFTARVYDTNSGRELGIGSAEQTITGANTSDCENQVTALLARRVADEVGPDVQRAWRDVAQDRAEALEVVSGPADWTLTVRGSELGMAAQADLMDALAAVPGIDSHAFLSQSANQLDLQVRYSGSEPLNLALYRRLRSSPAFANMDTEMTPGRLMVCQSGC